MWFRIAILFLVMFWDATSFPLSGGVSWRSTTRLCAAENDNTDTPTQQYRQGSLMAATVEQGRVPYGEESRKYRRTIFGHDDWVQHRNAERLGTNLQGIFFSGLYVN